MQGPEKNSYKEFDNEKKSCGSKIPLLRWPVRDITIFVLLKLSRDNFRLSRDKYKISRDKFELSRDN